MLDKVAVQPDTVGIRIQMYPVRFYIRHVVTLLQEQNITGDLCAGIALKGCVWQTDGSNQVCSLCKVFPHSRVFLVHGALGSDERHNAAGSDLVQGLSEKEIVNEPMVFIIPLIQHLKIPKRHITDGYIEEAVRHLHLFKSGNGNGAVLI